MPFISITRRYHFESAHYLPNVPEGHKCKRMHGHNYELLVTCDGGYYKPGGDVGWVIDFWDLDKIVQPLIDTIDHRCLNDIEGLENPTAENIAAWFCARLSEFDIVVKSVDVFETKDCWATATTDRGRRGDAE
jgi:6-pyruvoyltetrahydropterin/6-carboxytetrahydropterin synthase